MIKSDTYWGGTLITGFIVFIGDLEKQKYPNLNEEKFKKLGRVIYKKGETEIYQITP